MSTHTTNQEAVETVKKLIDKIETAMLTTISAEGLVSRPMQTQDIEFDGDLWFLTSKETDKYQELLKNPSVNVAYVDKSYVSIRGTAELVEDIERKKELWSPRYEAYLGTTYEDPKVVLIKVNTEAAEYWETGNTAKSVKQVLKKVVGKDDENEINKTVDLS
ncbi:MULTISPECIES: pyridoxamine 5'-phosphate oxidase family protein [Exiguobacterium]|uniref:Pyridoxamine 5'-phosphate oxidase family protein n=3 Tax=Exiguobacterium TaxID=33986 RepID=A0ABX8GCI0_EXIAC|nr:MULTISPECIES: pyridoxamine 5'-phosphate oxidase family protein [Exiguobacterium]AOT00189.1 general stress protein [Exiguobacterium sp. U13-1]KNH36877.1 general stress protein [Exiguobacterium acetylicum]MCQ4090824.1 pyridoxamine 5'-phosphate oxidase family protein [Exiguobacterium sp. LL15]QWB31146.1 pyridoxamine 5'-phosphate oxidase family protein [Exiguobacterium acetylicum]HCD58899.1 general stress protein [Exiguobacterium sp.]